MEKSQKYKLPNKLNTMNRSFFCCCFFNNLFLKFISVFLIVISLYFFIQFQNDTISTVNHCDAIRINHNAQREKQIYQLYMRLSLMFVFLPLSKG